MNKTGKFTDWPPEEQIERILCQNNGESFLSLLGVYLGKYLYSKAGSLHLLTEALRKFLSDIERGIKEANDNNGLWREKIKLSVSVEKDRDTEWRA